MNLDEAILMKLRNIREYCYYLKTKYKDEDIRISFFDGFHAILRFYYCSLNYCKSELFIQHQRSVYNKRNISIGDLGVNKQGFINMLNSKYIIDTWSNFELFLTILCNSLFSDEKRTKLMSNDYFKIRKELNDVVFTENHRKKLLKKFSKLFLHMLIQTLSLIVY